jgi:gliding motility-associated-like protein
MPYTILKKYFTLFVILLNINLAKAQLGKEAWNWQFGSFCELDFSSGNPVVGIDSTSVDEGTASISDAITGQLLFYTDGTFAWDRNNHRMPNGYGMIGGQGTSTQAALIVPKPGSSTVYYLFSADQGGYISPPNQGVHYSIVDMTLNAGLGDVVSTSKNILLTPPPTTEKLTAVRHCNGVDYWVITHSFNSNTFNVYLLTSSGINANPVVSNVGTVQNNVSGTYYETIGYLKASPNGKRLACAVWGMEFLELFDFDNSSGIVSNSIKITDKPKKFYPYGVAFSPDNSKLFVSADDSIPNNTWSALYEYDLSSSNSIGIMNSKIHIPYFVSGAVPSGALQLAPDNKIYATNYDINLHVINNPNDTGTQCNYQYYGTSNFFAGGAVFGLPNFIDANNISPVSNLINTPLCSFSSYSLGVNGISNYQWSTGDTTKHSSINNFGNYWVSYLNAKGCKEVDTFRVTQIQPPVINILHDTSVCSNNSISVNISATDTNAIYYLWNDGFTSPVHAISNSGVYWVDYTLNNFCVSRDSFNFNIYPYPAPIDLGNDTSFCLGKKQLNAYTQNCIYLWSTGETTSSIIATRAGDYWVQVNYNGCKTYDSLIVYPEYSAFNVSLPNIVTPNNDGINDFIDFSKYQFSTLQLEIYNRWGAKVFESNDQNCIWKPIEDDGTYFYTLQYRLDCGRETQSKVIKGFITLIK